MRLPVAVAEMALRGVASIAVALVMIAAFAPVSGSLSSGVRRALREWQPQGLGSARRGWISGLGSPRMLGEGKCDLCRDNWLFILAAGGRTGSTTALTMFSSVPGFTLTGEHWGLLNEASAIVSHLKAVQLQNGVAWANNGVDMHRVACSMQHLVKNVVLGNDFEALARESTVIGFKEIRYTSPDMLKFLHKMFPCARFVFPYRENTEAKVKALEFNQQALRQQWEQKRKVVLSTHQAFPNTTGLLGVENLSVHDYNRILNGLLGVKGCRFSHILHENADGGYTQHAQADSGLIEGTCDMSGVNFRLGPQQIEANKGRMWRLYNDLNAASAESPASQPPTQKWQPQKQWWQGPKQRQGSPATPKLGSIGDPKWQTTQL